MSSSCSGRVTQAPLRHHSGSIAIASGSEPAIAHEAQYAVIGAIIARAFAGVSASMLNTGYQVSYWVQMGTVFAFLVLLPVGEHFHIVTALPALFFAKRARSAW